MPLIPNDIRELVARNLDSLPKWLATASSAALVLSLCFEVGYFIAIDFTFIALLGPADLVKNTLIWALPGVAIIAGLIAHFDVHNTYKRVGSPGLYGTVALVLPTAFVLLMFHSFKLLDLWILSLAPIFVSTCGLMVYSIRGGNPSTGMTATALLLAVAISLIMSGFIAGYYDIRKYNKPHILVTTDEKKQIISLIRLLDKGVIVASPSEGVLFYPWARVGLIRRPDSRGRPGAPPPPI